MKHNEDLFIPCVVQPDAVNDTACDSLGRIHAGKAEFVVAQAVRKLVAVDLTDEELHELGFNPLAANSPAGHTKVAQVTTDCASTTYSAVDATLNVIRDQMKNLDLEAEMLSLRKRALKRRLRLLERLAKSLHSSDEDISAA